MNIIIIYIYIAPLSWFPLSWAQLCLFLGRHLAVNYILRSPTVQYVQSLELGMCQISMAFYPLVN